MSDRSINLLKRLTEADAPSGFEDEARRIFEDELREIGEIKKDRMGNLFCSHTGSSDTPVVMLDCHPDEVGFMVQSITSQGFIKFVPLGGWWGHVLLSQRMTVMGDKGKIHGVISATPPHLLEKGAREKVVHIEAMHIDVGAADREEAMDKFGIQPGNPIAPFSPFIPMANPKMLSAKAFDNRCGCGLVIESMQRLAEQDHPNQIYGVASVQEEVGIRGAEVSVARVKPDVAIVLEAPPADDLPGSDRDALQGIPGKGIQLRLFDPTMIVRPQLARFVQDIAEEKKIRHQVSVRRAGGTNARAIHRYGQGVATIVLGVPARYIHTHVSIIHIDDYLAGLDLVEALVMKLDEQALENIYR
ncbi:MAG: glutamyl aminopeptidase [Candidatus Cloacimonetes bacterium 4572_55]|nr:MAG: glutamyl aminopeptidase [Candidatus Cloacimonetes bacterium 4572_55]